MTQSYTWKGNNRGRKEGLGARPPKEYGFFLLEIAKAKNGEEKKLFISWGERKGLNKGGKHRSKTKIIQNRCGWGEGPL